MRMIEVKYSPIELYTQSSLSSQITCTLRGQALGMTGVTRHSPQVNKGPPPSAQRVTHLKHSVVEVLWLVSIDVVARSSDSLGERRNRNMRSDTHSGKSYSSRI